MFGGSFHIPIILFQSISRQHAVINVLNSNEFMLMDLESANKTKIQGVSIYFVGFSLNGLIFFYIDSLYMSHVLLKINEF